MLEMGMLTSPRYVLFSCWEAVGKGYCLGTVGETWQSLEILPSHSNMKSTLQSQKCCVAFLFQQKQVQVKYINV